MGVRILLWVFLLTAASCGVEQDLDDWSWDDGSDEPPGEALADGRSVAVRPGPTKNAELVDTLPVGRSSSRAKRRVVLRLEPDQIPDLRSGDVFAVAAEVQVTTRCDIGQTAPGCDYNPKVAAQLILTGERGDKYAGGAESVALTPIEKQSCTKNDHHCMFVFRPGETRAALEDSLDLPCVAADACHVNLVMWAWHPDARSDGKDKLIVGGNEGNYLVNRRTETDKARLMVVRERGIDGSDRLRRETSGGGGIAVPTDTRPVRIFSHRLKAGELIKGEQYVVDVKLVTEVSSRARFSTQLIVTKDRNATSGSVGKISPGQIGEHNGINCTSGSSPCTTRKVAVFRVTDDIADPVYVNVIAKSAVPGGGSARVTVKRGNSWVRSTRYRAALRR